MPRQVRPDRFPNDGLNRAAVIFDGDNVRTTLADYGYLPHFDDILDWVADPANLGIDKLVSACAFFTVPHPNTIDHRTLPLRQRSRFCQHLLVDPKRGPGYRDEAMYAESLRLAPRINTLVIVSSDGGADGGVYKFASELRRGYDRFRQISEPTLACEVVCISSHLGANANWQRQAVNAVAIEDIYPQLKHRLPKLRPFSAISA